MSRTHQDQDAVPEAPPTARTGRRDALGLLLTALLALTATIVLARGAALLLPMAREGYGAEAMLALVLLLAALAGAALCAYLVLVHAMAAAVIVIGPTRPGARPLLATLRVLAPRLAARALATLAVTTAAAGLITGPAQASEMPPQLTSASVATAPLMRLHNDDQQPAGSTAGRPSPGADRHALPAGGPATDGPSDADDLPGLGWGESSSEERGGSDEKDARGESGGSDGSGARSTEPAKTAPRRTVVVQPGDSLWSISDDLLGVGQDPPQEIALAWPRLHAANLDVIGEDPDHLEPGQVLVVPDTLPTTAQEQ